MAEKGMVEQYTEEVRLNTQEIEKNTEAIEKNTEAKNDNAKEGDKVVQADKKITDQTKQLDFQLEKVGSTANTALGVLAASFAKSNPLVATAIGSVQKLIPNIMAIGSAAKQAGSLAKAAISSTGVGLLITTLTTVITLFEQFKQKAKDAAEESKRAAQEAADAWKKTEEEMYKTLKTDEQKNDERIKGEISYWETKKKYIGYDVRDRKKTQDQANKEIAQINDKIAALNKELSTNKKLSEAEKARKEKAIKAAAEYDAKLKGLMKNSETYVLTSLESETARSIKFLDEALKKGKIGIEEHDEAVAKLNRDLVNAKLNIDEMTRALKKLTDSSKNDLKGLGDEIVEVEEDVVDVFTGNELDVSGAKMMGFLADTIKYADMASKSIGSIGSAYQSVLDYQLKAGKITQDEYNKQFEAVKAFQYAQTVINGLSGSIAIWTDSTTPIAGKIAAQVSLAAEVVAALAQIKATNLDSNGTMTATQKANVAYITNAPQQTYVTNQTDMSGVVNAINGVQTVLVVDDVTKLQNSKRKVRTISSF